MTKLNIRRERIPDPSSAEASGKGAGGRDIGRMKKMVRRQAILAGATLLIVVILLFAMTSAWYTNVSKVSSLTFRAEAWGFDPENISVSDHTVNVAPGTSGIVPLTIDNTSSSDSVRVYVTASKLQMERDELRKRIFFYADTSRVVENENVSRIYLGATEEDSYDYTLLPGMELILSDEYHSDVPIKWEWVYDMVGYYFRGTVTGGIATINEYLRPIEYDLDRAVFDLDGEGATGNLVSVGSTTVEELLEDVSSHDGYEGTIDMNDAVTVGQNYVFYPVSVDGNDHGVWAYLCTYSEIESGIDFDTSLSGELGDIIANFTVTAVNLPSRVDLVSSQEELRSALSNDNVEVLELAGDIELSSALTLDTGASATLDLNGFGITYTGSETDYSMIRARGGSELTIINGEIIGNGNTSGVEGRVSSIAIDAVCADVTISNVAVSACDTAVYIADNGGAGSDSVVRLYNCDLETENLTVFIMGNGDISEAPSRLVVENCTINSTTYAGISGQGSTNRWGTDIVVLNSTVSGKYSSPGKAHHWPTSWAMMGD